MIKLSTYVHHKGLLVLGAFSKLVEVVLELFLPIFMGILIDEGIGNLNNDVTYKMLIFIFIFAVLGYLSTVFAHFLTAKVSQDYANQLRLALFDKVIDFDHEERNKFSSSTLLNRLNNDVLQTSNALAMSMRIASRAPFMMIGSIIALLLTAEKIAVVFMIVLPLVLIFVLIIVNLLLKNNQKLQTEMDDMSIIVKENIEGIQSIQAYVQSDYELNRFNRKKSSVVNIQKKLSNLSSMGSPVVSVVLNLALILMIYLAGLSINIGDMTQGQVISMINYTMNLILAVLAIFNLILLYARAITANERIRAVLSIETKIDNKPIYTQKISKLNFENVEYAYKDQSNFLKDINLEINEGEIIGILGLTGSGKSTLLKLINRLIEPKKGKVLINHLDYLEVNKQGLKDKVAYVDQKNMLLTGTVRSNLSMGKRYSDETLLEALNTAAFPMELKDLDNVVLKDGANYSGGQRQRLNIARALVKKSDILIMDDSFASLDNHTQHIIKTNLLKLSNKPIILIAASRLDTLDIASKIIVLNNGSIEAVGNSESLMNSSLTYQKIYQSQNDDMEVA